MRPASPVSAKSVAVVVAVLAVIGLLAYGLLSKNGDSLAIGDRAPDRELTTLDGNGNGRLADYRGHWVLVNFWASWCQPCRAEAPALERFWRANRGHGAVVLGVDLDDASGDAQAFAREFGLTYPLLRQGDGDSLKQDFGMTGLPENFVVDPSGAIRLIQRGPIDAAFLRDRVEPLIARDSAS
jgi:cytochrome c biogenesis protein CcmG, thiol:disulfide interchange protein DsbE